MTKRNKNNNEKQKTLVGYFRQHDNFNFHSDVYRLHNNSRNFRQMKNIHVLPTDKPSRLIKNNLGYGLNKENFNQSDLDFIQAKFQHIYITSDEVTKEGGFYYWEVTNTVQIARKDSHGRLPTIKDGSKKIILTTDQDLIKDGVQAIDDEFLKWFVKNPSCEFVEIKLQHQYHTSKEYYIDADYVDCTKEQYNSIKSGIPTCPLRILYKIIIPQEEPKIDSIFNEANVRFSETLDKLSDNSLKQETLEEAIKREYETRKFNSDFPFDPQSFKLGAKWQQERMYQSMKECWYAACAYSIGSHKEFKQTHPNFKEWFEQFKKKQ
jgi:hypothetical protein